MDKRLLIIILIFIGFYLLTRPTFTLQNGDFENGVVNWSIRHGFSLDTEVAHSGTTSLRADPTFYDSKIDPTKGDARASWRKSVLVKPGQKIVATGFIKTTSADCDYGLRIGMDMKTMNGTILRAINGEFVPWGNDWTFRQINATVRPGEERVTFWVQGKPYDCPGIGWFDDITFIIRNI